MFLELFSPTASSSLEKNAATMKNTNSHQHLDVEDTVLSVQPSQRKKIFISTRLRLCPRSRLDLSYDYVIHIAEVCPPFL